MHKVSPMAAIVAALIALGGVTAATADDAQPAVWKQQTLIFSYSGFTSRYTCLGLRDKVREVLLALGARKEGLSVSYFSCGADLNRPSPFPGVKLRFSSLQPAASGATDTVAARWSALDLGKRANLEQGDCELAEQLEQKVLPLFATRKLVSEHACTPRQLPTGRPTLQLEVLSLAAPAP